MPEQEMHRWEELLRYRVLDVRCSHLGVWYRKPGAFLCEPRTHGAVPREPQPLIVHQGPTAIQPHGFAFIGECVKEQAIGECDVELAVAPGAPATPQGREGCFYSEKAPAKFPDGRFGGVWLLSIRGRDPSGGGKKCSI
jgi:hypothetical protein